MSGTIVFGPQIFVPMKEAGNWVNGFDSRDVYQKETAARSSSHRSAVGDAPHHGRMELSGGLHTEAPNAISEFSEEINHTLDACSTNVRMDDVIASDDEYEMKVDEQEAISFPFGNPNSESAWKRRRISQVVHHENDVCCDSTAQQKEAYNGSLVPPFHSQTLEFPSWCDYNMMHDLWAIISHQRIPTFGCSVKLGYREENVATIIVTGSSQAGVSGVILTIEEMCVNALSTDAARSRFLYEITLSKQRNRSGEEVESTSLIVHRNMSSKGQMIWMISIDLPPMYWISQHIMIRDNQKQIETSNDCHLCIFDYYDPISPRHIFVTGATKQNVAQATREIQMLLH